MSKHKLTVTFPVFERKDFFHDALLSVINQTVKCDILVVDNCSSHNYFKVLCEKYGITYFRNNTNIGLFPNWNKCMSLVETKYAMIFQDDNIMLPNFVEEFENTISKHPDIDLYFTDFKCIDLASKEISAHKHNFPFGYMSNGDKVIEHGIKEKLGFPYAFILDKKHFSLYYYECHGSNDWLWVYSNVKNLVVFGNEKNLYLYGSHPNQDSKNALTHIKCILSISYIYKQILKNNCNTLRYKNIAEYRYKNTFFYFLGISTDEFLNSLKTDEHIYAKFYRKALTENNILRIFSNLSYPIRNLLFRLIRKIFKITI